MSAKIKLWQAERLLLAAYTQLVDDLAELLTSISMLEECDDDELVPVVDSIDDLEIVALKERFDLVIAIGDALSGDTPGLPLWLYRVIGRARVLAAGGAS